jgi:hypothetical protein
LTFENLNLQGILTFGNPFQVSGVVQPNTDRQSVETACAQAMSNTFQQIVVFEPPDLYHRSSDSGELQYNSRRPEKKI